MDRLLAIKLYCLQIIVQVKSIIKYMSTKECKITDAVMKEQV